MIVREQVDLLFGSGMPASAGVFPIGAEFAGSVVDNGVMIVHVRRAHERILYERMLERATANTSSQALMFPVPLRLSAAERQQLDELLDTLQHMGYRFDLRTTPPSLTAVPVSTTAGTEHESLRALLETVDNLGRPLADQQLERLVALAASQQAVRSNQPRSAAVLQQIVQDVLACDVPNVTPGGEPIYTVITYDEIHQRL